MRWVKIIAVLALLGGAGVQAQNTVHPHALGLRWHGGFLFAHHPDMRHLSDRHFSAFEVHYQRLFSGDKRWHRDYNIPAWGITALGMPVINDQIGSAYALFPYYYLPLNSGERIRLNLKLGAGLGVLTERFDRVENHKNIAISTRLNVALQIGFDCRVRVADRLDWNTGVFLTHFSNGAVRMPNLGLNFITVSSGLAYRLGPAETREYKRKPFSENRNVSWSLFAGMGLKQARVLQGDIRPAVTLQLLAEKRLSRKFSLGAGAELNYNAALPLAYEARDMAKDGASPLRGGLLVSSAFHFGRMEILAQVGAYVIDTGLIDGRIFNRFGLRHNISEKVKLNLTLRTHYAKADHFELGVVYKLSML